MKRILFILLVILQTLQFTASAQDRKVSGTVTDAQFQPLVGVYVQIKDTDKGVITDIDGHYTITLPGGDLVLVYSYLGMETKEIQIRAGQTKKDVVLQDASTQLDQVIVTGYAQTTTKKMTGSVGVVSSDILKEKPQISVDAMLQGQLAGVSVNATSGQPGRSQKIRIRGQSTLTGNQSPLWVVDGVPLQGEKPDISDSQLKAGGFEDLFINGVGDINPNDIENITILKDAAAAAIYGSRAANGVIVVTTKRGGDGPMKVNYSGNVSVTLAPQRDGDLMDSRQKIAWEDELWNEFSADRFAAGEIYPTVGIVGMVRSGYGRFASMAGDKAAQDAYLEQLSGQTTDWFDVIFRDAVSTNHHLDVSGGSTKYNYYVGLGYTHDAGLLIKDNYNRYNVKSNFTFNPIKAIRLDLGVDFSMQDSNSPNLSDVDPFHYAYYANPYEGIYNEDGSYRADETWQNLSLVNGSSVAPIYDKGFNIMREIDHTSSNTKNWATNLRLGGEFNILKTLKFVGLLSYSYATNRTEKINEKNTYAAWSNQLDYDRNRPGSCYGSIIQNNYGRDSYLARGHFSYVERYNENHSLSLLAGAEIRSEDSKTLYSKRLNYDVNTQTTSLPAPPTGGGQLESWMKEVERLSGEYFTKSRYASFYASADYFLTDRYVFNASFRTDGSSFFGSKKQFNPTWSAGAAWHIGQEKFMRWSRKVLDYLILRASTGFTGNINNGVSPLLIMQYWDQEYRKYEGESLPMGTFSGAPNPNLGWEKTNDSKVSLEFGFFKERLTGIVEGYFRRSTDVVVSSQVPSMTGYSYQKFNSADINNSGIEFTLGGKIVNTKDVKLSASVNFSYNRNRVTRYDSMDKLTPNTRFWEGYPTDALFMGKVEGLTSEGLYQFKIREDAVIQSVKDYQVGDNYRYFIGTGIAPYTGGFNISFSYKTFTLSCSGAYSAGGKTFEQPVPPGSWSSAYRPGFKAEHPQTIYSDLYSNHFNVKADRTDRWTESHPNAKYPRIYDAYGTPYDFDDDNPMDLNIIQGAYVKDNSYLRIKNIVLSYAFPSKLMKKAHMRSLRMNLSLNNFFTITNYDGLDPETPGAVYPISRSITFGLNFGF